MPQCCRHSYELLFQPGGAPTAPVLTSPANGSHRCSDTGHPQLEYGCRRDFIRCLLRHYVASFAGDKHHFDFVCSAWSGLVHDL
jgi:hypothetical protein